tara:strand:+ start:82 stop:273 length:192 start_codon:yes stop_codon:yes gene_type:complete
VQEHKLKEVKDIHQVQYEQILSLINILTERIDMLENKQNDEYKLVNDRINEIFDIIKMIERKL